MPNGRQIGVEIAADDSLQQTGLSGRKCLPHNGGMLFSFQQPGYYQFWMKDMYFPLDIVWLDSDHKVVSINQYVLPQTYPKTFTSSSPAQYVIEINQGLVAKLGLTAGQLISF